MEDIKVQGTEMDDIDINNMDLTGEGAEAYEAEKTPTKTRLKEILNLYGDTFANLAKYIGISYQSLNKKLNGHVDFKQSEIKAIKKRYTLDAEQINYIFFRD